jgi:hypothetical protein
MKKQITTATMIANVIQIAARRLRFGCAVAVEVT